MRKIESCGNDEESSVKLKAWCDTPGRVIVKHGDAEHGMTIEEAVDLHRQIFEAVMKAATDKHGRWAWENPDPGKDPP